MNMADSVGSDPDEDALGAGALSGGDAQSAIAQAGTSTGIRWLRGILQPNVAT